MTSNKEKGILILSPFFHPNIGGVESHLIDLTEYLSSNGYETYVLTYKPITTKDKALSVEVKQNLEIHRFWWFGFNLFHRLEPYPVLEFLYLTPWLFFRSFLWMLKNQKRIEVIHAQGFNASFIAKILAKIFGKTFVASTHAIYEVDPQSLTARLMHWTLKSADTILTLSKQSKEELTRLGLFGSKIIVYKYWVNQDIFKPIDKIKAKKQLGWEDKFVVLFVGRFIKIKGIDVLLEVARQSRNNEIYFAFVGDGPMSKEIQIISKTLENVIFVGKVDNCELPLYYNASDIFIIPSQYEEGFGRVILEAVSCGLPVIGANRGGIPEAVDKTVSILIESTDENLKNAIEELYTNKTKYQLLAGNSRVYALNHFSSTNCKGILDAYRVN
ncbi:MAG: glycosyltransferase family 4 protein [Methanosarcinaceae archaeon]|nr:glycosyltransferase family 4 protein [Methanosarcinaceae archaeon]